MARVQLLPFIKVVEFEGPNIADKDIARMIALGKSVEIHPGLPVGLAEISACALLFHNEHSGPKQVNEALTTSEFRNVLFVVRSASSPHSEYLKELVVETLRFAFLVGCVLPLLGKGSGTIPNFIPQQTHPTRVAMAVLRCNSERAANSTDCGSGHVDCRVATGSCPQVVECP